MNYRIIGADGKTYGPVGLPDLRQWIAQSRADARTLVHVEGAADWTYLGLLPELAADFSAPPQRIGAVTPGVSRGTNSLATAGFVCGLLAWMCCCCSPCCFPFSLAGLLLSLVALAQISSQSPPPGGRALAIIGLVLSAAHLLFTFGMILLHAALPQGNVNWQAHFP